MLFDKDIPQICAYCLYGQDYGEDAVLCSKKGPMEPQDHCGRFVYDLSLIHISEPTRP